MTPNTQQLLAEEFQKRKARNPNFSLRAFARWLEISPAQLSQVMAGKRPVTLALLKRVSERLGLSPAEKARLATGLLRGSKGPADEESPGFRQLEEDRFRLIADWYHFAILSLTRVPGAKSDPRWVASRLGIRADEANQALRRLERLGILETKPRFRQVGEPLEVVSEVPSEAIRKYHKQNLGLAAEKIETVPVAMRQYQALSFPMNPARIAALKQLIDSFLNQAVQVAESRPGSEVYHLNVQLFPVTRVRSEE